MKPIHIVRILVIASCFGLAPSLESKPQADTSFIHIGGKVRGTIINLACEAMPYAQITFRNKKQVQIITPDKDGHFLVDLPPGDYMIIVRLSSHSTYKIKSGKPIVQRNKRGELCILVDTGIEATHCYSFEPDSEDQLIPVEPVIIKTEIQERKLIPVP